jgi:4'-phosphopantetheinyl transferase EntD
MPAARGAFEASPAPPYRQSVVEQILPPGVVAVSTRGELEVELSVSELATIRRAVGGRRREFTTGRACARAALVGLGLPPLSIPAGSAGEPCWPPGVVGSITHCEGYRAAAVARAVDRGALAIDAEPNRPLPAGVLAAIAAGEERARVRRYGKEAAGVCWDRLLFSAKEAVFKLWFPLTGEKLGFTDADIEIDLASATFRARLGAGRPVLDGRWLVGEGLLVTGICLSPEQSLQCDHDSRGRVEWQRRERSIRGASRRPCENR